VVQVLLVHKDVELRRKFAQLLAGQPAFIEAGSIGTVAASSILPNSLQPDVTILGVVDGKETAAQIQALKKQFPHTAILLMARKTQPANVEHALRVGAMGWVLEDDAPAEWLDALRAIQRGQLYVSTTISSGLLQRVLQSTPGSNTVGVDSLTDRELVIFELLGTGLGTVEIARRLNLSAKTIESHREKIKHRLGLADSAALLHFAYAWNQRRGPAEPGAFPAHQGERE
jgi:DNA-binding NarL/FixJ family response regulator